MINVAVQIENAIRQGLSVQSLHIENESARHRGHSGDNGTGQTHFHIEVVSNAFEGLGRVQRQRLINDLIAPLFSQGLHAASMKLSTPSEIL